MPEQMTFVSEGKEVGSVSATGSMHFGPQGEECVTHSFTQKDYYRFIGEKFKVIQQRAVNRAKNKAARKARRINRK